MTEIIKELEQQFQQFEQSIGINEQNFGNKFIFQKLRENLIKASGESNENLQKFLDQCHTNLFLDISSKVQADLDGLTKEQQSLLHFYGASIISDACQYLQLPITTCTSAQTIFHRFYTNCSFLKHDLRDVAMGSVFLAGKAQETIKKPRDLAYVFDQIFKIEEGQPRPVTLIDDKSYKFNRMRQVVQDMEREILKELGFELYQITWNEQPHRLMYFYINLFKPNPSNQSSSFQNLTRIAFNYLNDSYKTNVCVYFPFQTIVACCIYLAFRKTGIEMPRIAWWTIMETSLKNLKLGAGKIQSIYNQFKTLPKIVDCLEILNNLAKQKEFELEFSVKYHELPDRQGPSVAPLSNKQAVQEAIAKSKQKQTLGQGVPSSSEKLQSSEQLEKKDNQEENIGVSSLRDITSNRESKHSKFSQSNRSPSREDRHKRSASHKKSHKRKSSRSRSKSRDRNRDRKDKDKKYQSRRSRSRDRRERSNSHKDKKRRSKSRDRKKEKQESGTSKVEEQQLNGKSQQSIQIEAEHINGSNQTNGNGAVTSTNAKSSDTPEQGRKSDKRSPSYHKKEKNYRDRDSSTSRAKDRKDKDKERERERERERDRKERKKSKSRSRSHNKKQKRYNSPNERDSRRKRSRDRKKESKRSRSNSKEKSSKFSISSRQNDDSKKTPSPPLKQDKFSSQISEKSNDISTTQPKESSGETKSVENNSNGKPTLSLQQDNKKSQLLEQIKNVTKQAQEQSISSDEKKKLGFLQQIKSSIQNKTKQIEEQPQQQDEKETQQISSSSSKPKLDLNSKLAEKFKQYNPLLQKNSSQQQKPVSSDDDEQNDNDNQDNENELLMKLRMIREQNKQKAKQGNQ